MWETLTNDPANQLTGDVTVALSAIPTEYLYDTETQSIGYTYTYFSSSAEVLRVATSSTYSVTFSLPVSQYFYQIKNVQAISDVVFLTVLRVLFLLLALSSPILSPIVTTAGQTTPQVVAHPLRPPIRTTLCPLFNSQSSLCGSGAHPPWCLVVCCCFSVDSLWPRSFILGCAGSKRPSSSNCATLLMSLSLPLHTMQPSRAF